MQITKEIFIPVFEELNDCLQMTRMMMEKVKVNEHILDDPKYDYLFSVEEVNRLASEGMPFRDAYKKVGIEINEGKFRPDKTINHTHEGSIGNLCNDKIKDMMHGILQEFDFEKVKKAENDLLNS